MLAFRLACERPADIAAVAPVAGSVEVVPCRSERPPSVLAIHGDADRNHPLEGGRGERAVSGVAYRPLREGMDALAAAGGCSSEPTEEIRGAVTVLDWPGCRDGRTVEARIVAGADHPWPGSDPLRNPAEAQGAPSQALDATQEVVDFLLAHRT
jgi:polyhydroxybutyrate depolymerase